MLIIKRVANGYIITGDNEEQWIATSQWDVANLVEKLIGKGADDVNIIQ